MTTHKHIIHKYNHFVIFLFCKIHSYSYTSVAPSKVLESVAEGEDKETDSSEEKTVSKAVVKEEVETPELKV